MRVQGARTVATVSTLVNPMERAGGAFEVHGLTADMLAGAPIFERIAADLRSVLSGAVFIAHGAAWDVRFLQEEFNRIGQPLDIVHWLDTLARYFRLAQTPSTHYAVSSASLAGERIARRATWLPCERSSTDVWTYWSPPAPGIFGMFASVSGGRGPRSWTHARRPSPLQTPSP
jgi:hypothetical protein